MHFLIDGYNLLHAMGVLHGQTGPAVLERARLRLLGLLRGSYGPEADRVTVVFDAAKAPPGAVPRFDYHGIHVVFAVGQCEADDLIEEFIRKASTPKDLTVVSDDHRIQQAARRRRCPAQGCLDYVEDLGRQRRRLKPPPTTPAKPEAPSPTETEHWLAEFADLADDPALKELFDPYDFGAPEG
jgi:predicted RNA-binding protein with PIN domain